MIRCTMTTFSAITKRRTLALTLSTSNTIPLFNGSISSIDSILPSTLTLNQYVHQPKRYLSTSTSTIVPIYKRHPKRSFFPRALVSLSTLHFGYWTWYVLDFTPAVNASGLDNLYVDPTMGYLGLGIASGMMGAAWMYPRFLISEIGYDVTERRTLIQCFSLPFVSPKKLVMEGMTGVSSNTTVDMDNVIDHSTMTVKMDAEATKMTLLGSQGIFPSGHVPITIQTVGDQAPSKLTPGFLLLDVDLDMEKKEIVNDSKLQALLMGWSMNDKKGKRKITKKKREENGSDGFTAKQLALKKRIIRRRGRV